MKIIDKQFFKLHQKKLLFIANNHYLRWLLGLNHLGFKIDKVDLITPNSIHSNNVGYFFAAPRFAESLVYNLSPVAYFQYGGKRQSFKFSPVGLLGILLVVVMTKGFGFLAVGAVDYYAGGGDGQVEKSSGDTNWNTCHDATAGSAADYESETANVKAKLDTGQYSISRGFFPVDTSGLPDGVTITGANFVHTVSSIQDTPFTYRIVQTTQADTGSLVTGDYDQCGAIDDPTAGASDQSISTTGTKTVALNATGLGWITDSGWTKLGIRERAHDADDEAATGNHQIDIYTSNRTGTSEDPYLAISYTINTTVTDTVTLADTITGSISIIQSDTASTTDTGSGAAKGYAFTVTDTITAQDTEVFTLPSWRNIIKSAISWVNQSK
jgi:hypothetical protein